MSAGAAAAAPLYFTALPLLSRYFFTLRLKSAFVLAIIQIIPLV